MIYSTKFGAEMIRLINAGLSLLIIIVLVKFVFNYFLYIPRKN